MILDNAKTNIMLEVISEQVQEYSLLYFHIVFITDTSHMQVIIHIVLQSIKRTKDDIQILLKVSQVPWPCQTNARFSRHVYGSVGNSHQLEIS